MSKQTCNPLKFLKLVPSFAALLLMGSLLAGCSVQAVRESQPTPAESMSRRAAENAELKPPTSAPAPTTENIPPDGQAPIAETGRAVVEQIEVRILESFPVQAQAALTGYLPDGCTQIVDTEVVSGGTTFRIRMTTERPDDAICTQAIVSFEKVVPIDVTGYAAGSYDIRVNDLTASFELP